PPDGMYANGGINHHPAPFTGAMRAGGNLSGAALAVANTGGVGSGSLGIKGCSNSYAEGSSDEPVSSGAGATRFPQRVRTTIAPSVMSVSPRCNDTFLRVQ